jgi:hypothetical protein
VYAQVDHAAKDSKLRGEFYHQEPHNHALIKGKTKQRNDRNKELDKIITPLYKAGQSVEQILEKMTADGMAVTKAHI